MKKTVKIFLVLIFCFVFILLFVFAGIVFLYPKKYNYEIEKHSKQYNLNSNLVYALVRAESSFNPNAVSSSGAIGLMQLMPNTAMWVAGKLNETFELQSLYNHETNIKYGCFYLRYLLNKFNNETYALCAYNAGETVVRSWINSQENFKIPYPETARYIKKIENGKKVYAFLNKLS